MSTTSTRRKQIACSLRDKDYRDEFVSAEISVTLPFQIKANREARGWNQAMLVEKSGQQQPTISRMERPGYDKFTLTTLRRLASAFDCGLLVRFVPFSQLIEWADRVAPEELAISPFDADTGIENITMSEDTTRFFTTWGGGLSFDPSAWDDLLISYSGASLVDVVTWTGAIVPSALQVPHGKEDQGQSAAAGIVASLQ